MYDKFYALPEEKQQRIINSGFEVFGQNDYKHASTDLIAAKAGISKGALFYYFKNKKEFYLFLYNYLIEVMTKLVVDEEFLAITDFFEMMRYAVLKKEYVLQRNPHIMDFSMRAFYSNKESVSENLQIMTQDYEEMVLGKYFSRLETYKFKEEAGNLVYIYKMLRWMADGYMHEMHMTGKRVTPEELAEEFERWMTILKKLVYKEEYQDD